MRIETTPLDGLVLMRPAPFRDERGLFTRTFDATIFDEHMEAVGSAARAARFVQDSQSRTAHGVLRGLHGRSGRGEGKLVRCSRGAVLDVVVDARRSSPTFGQHFSVTLDDDDFLHLYVPAGFLHGFQVLSDVADVCYRIDRPHDPTEDISVRFDDPELGIEWSGPPASISMRDERAGSWATLARQLSGGEGAQVG